MRVFPTSWIYRIVFYLYCVSLNPVLSACWDDFRSLGFGGVHASTLARVLEVFTSCGVHEFYLPLLEEMRKEPIVIKLMSTSDSETGKLYRGLLINTEKETGCDALRVLSIFWHLIVSFYPSREMWAIHRMLCICVLLHLIFQNSLAHLDSNTYLSNEHALILLQRHGEYLEAHEASRWMYIFQILKPRVTGSPLPSLSSLKRALKLK
ncbi:unnamed protein product [Phytomonas sp. EM1]|nr:unnamed protein product [Phytomonas sp. EM1]|eukprot:CCW62487.1 unnamed protein product [Phytomonas sp. isolate EM1]